VRINTVGMPRQVWLMALASSADICNPIGPIPGMLRPGLTAYSRTPLVKNDPEDWFPPRTSFRASRIVLLGAELKDEMYEWSSLVGLVIKYN
jgi:hypothetical protein